ncbi:hypothetical protein EGH22_16625 [Halomicroarcula sp. F28]|uniref:hypothetical protein n=1 Tax=Haloarcula salinisoli TaxID=2487746 RepID=UPI001C738EA1|nr:hypothetical protein [Halomicroarcula salinisoli]MBX0287959.1 hypothetical protein [Halomicroarcula salinisoli]
MSDADDMAAKIESLEARVDELEQLIHDGQASDDVTGMREFVEDFGPDTHAERALAIAYYLEQYQNHENFSSADIEDGYRTCRVQKPANMSDVLGDLEDKEWAMSDGKEGNTRFRRLTIEGLNTVEKAID